MISDKPRFIVQEANSDVILNRDLEVRDPKFGGQLSGPCSISFSLDPFANPWIDWERISNGSLSKWNSMACLN